MKENAKRYLKMLGGGIKTMFKEGFNKETWKKQLANLFTFFRLVTPFITFPLSMIGLSAGISSLLITCSALTGVAALTDVADGQIAKRLKTKSEFGKVLDAVTDKIFVGVTGINLLILNPMYFITLAGELFIASINSCFILKHKKFNPTSSQFGRVKTFPLFLLLVLGYLGPVSGTILKIINTSIVSMLGLQLAVGGHYIIRNSKQIKELDNNKSNQLPEEPGLGKSKELEPDKILEQGKNHTPSRAEQIEALKHLREKYTDGECFAQGAEVMEHGSQKKIGGKYGPNKLQ